MEDTKEGKCRICGEDTDLIEGLCQECQRLQREEICRLIYNIINKKI